MYDTVKAGMELHPDVFEGLLILLRPTVTLKLAADVARKHCNILHHKDVAGKDSPSRPGLPWPLLLCKQTERLLQPPFWPHRQFYVIFTLSGALALLLRLYLVSLELEGSSYRFQTLWGNACAFRNAAFANVRVTPPPTKQAPLFPQYFLLND